MVSQPDNGLDKVAPLQGATDVTRDHSDPLYAPFRLAKLESLAHAAEDVSAILAVISKLRDLLADFEGDGREMTPERVRQIREKCGLSQSGLAKVLRLGASGKRTVVRWESAEGIVPGPVSVALEALEAGWRPGDSAWKTLKPEYMAVLDAIESAVITACQDARARIGSKADE